MKTWAISGVDLHLDPRGRAYAPRSRPPCATRFRPGGWGPDRLPSSRALAADLGIARNTVAEAYGQLVAEGWLTAVQGSGTRVAQRPETTEPPQRRGARHPNAGPATTSVPGSPDVSAFPRPAWLSAARRALTARPFRALDYGDPRGVAGVASRARRVRRARPRGPRNPRPRRGLLGLHARVPAPVRGAPRPRREDARDRALTSRPPPAPRRRSQACADRRSTTTAPPSSRLAAADVALLTPAHQFPIGAPLVARRRGIAVEWTQATGGLIIEDDYDGEFRYDRQPLGSLQALAPQRVVYAGTASKTLAPGVRLGWLVLPADLVDDVVAAKALADRNSSAIDQLTLAELIVSGAYDRHVRRSRLVYRRRRDRLVAALRRHAPRVRISGIAAGLHALVELPDGLPEEAVVERAAQRGLSVQGLGEYAHGPHTHRPALVVGYAKPPEHAFTGAVARLAAVLRDATG